MSSPRRTFKPFEQSPRDGTPFNVAITVRFNPFANTYEALMLNNYSGDLEWIPHPFVWTWKRFCDLLPPECELPKGFTAAYVATVARPTLRQRLTRYLTQLVAKVRG